MKDEFDLKKERICEYEVLPGRKKMWAVEMNILQYIAKICKENNLTYFACDGTALGAVRHKGFIPWDDDIDLGMVREDFEVFLQKAPQYFPDYISIQYGISDHGFDPICRIRDSRTTGCINGEGNAPGSKGIFVEIYVFDYTNDNRMRKVQRSCSRVLSHIMYSACDTSGRTSKTKQKLCRIIPTKALFGLFGKVCSLTKKEKAAYIDVITLPKYCRTGTHFFPVSGGVRTKEVPFEYTSISLAEQADTWLRINYKGDYMQLPPVDKRGTHHSTVVFYDPFKPYEAYKGSDIPGRFYKGEYKLSPIFCETEE